MTEEKKLVEVVLESGTFYTNKIISKYSDRGGSRDVFKPGDIKAFIPGTIVDLKVKEGDIVKSGDVLMLFGAMKMDNVIIAPFDGKVSSINVTVGESVPKGFVMISIEE